MLDGLCMQVQFGIVTQSFRNLIMLFMVSFCCQSELLYVLFKDLQGYNGWPPIVHGLQLDLWRLPMLSYRFTGVVMGSRRCRR